MCLLSKIGYLGIVNIGISKEDIYMKKTHLIFIAMFLLILTGCTSAEDNIYEVMEATAKKEENFEKQQEPLAKLEAEEKAIFDEIMELGMKEFDQITELADQALANLDEREELLKIEKESIESSKSEFQKVAEEIGKIKDEELKEEADQLQSIMENRYATHDKLYDFYLQGLNEDRKIYELIKKEDLEMEELAEQIEKTNEVYEMIIQENNLFNEQTDQFNEAKLQFYNNAGIKIQVESSE